MALSSFRLSFLPRLDRYVVAEISGPLGLGFLVYTFILLVQFLFRSAELIIRRGLALGVVGEILLYTLPNIIALTLPMALLFGILVAVGRLSSDSELVALRASGVSLGRLYRPVLATGAALAALTAVVMIWLLPGGNHALTQTLLAATAQSAARQIEPRVFNEDWEQKVLYVFDADAAGWRSVFVADSITGDLSEVTIAASGNVRVDDAGERVALHLEDTVTHKVDLAAPDRYETSASRTTDQVLEDHLLSEERARVSQSKSLRSMTSTELRATIADRTKDVEQRRRAVVELHKKASIPAACLAFAFLALPLGFNNRRGGKSSGFALSIAVIVGYYLLLNNGEKAARYDTLPAWLAAWLPNLILLALAGVLAWRRNRDLPMLPFGASRRGRRWRRARQPEEADRSRRSDRPDEGSERAVAGDHGTRPHLSPTLVLRLPRPRLAFPNLLDRYVLRVFAANFGLVALSAMTIYLIADFGQIVDEVFKNKVSGEIVARYYRYFALQIFHDLAPLLVLITTLVTFGLLARSNEVTAAKALGVSLFRLGAPALVAAAAVSLFCVFLQAQVLPATNDKAAHLRDRIYGKPVARTYRRADRQWLFGQGRYIYNYRLYDERRQTLQRLQVFEFDSDARLVSRLFTESAQFRDGRWIFTDTWTRTFRGAEVVDYQRRPGPIVVDYPETPEYFQSEIERPAQMRYGELREYTRELRAAGQPLPELDVQLQSRIAFPFVAVVMCVVALPFAFRLGKHGALYGLGLSVVLGIVYLVVYAFFKTLGETGALPATVAVWSPSALFALFAAYLFLGVRS